MDIKIDKGSRGFSDGVPIDHVETAKSRVIIHNLEAEWWLLAVC